LKGHGQIELAFGGIGTKLKEGKKVEMLARLAWKTWNSIQPPNIMSG